MSLVSPMFSVCMPSYNREAFIGEAIASVLAQSCEDFELIASDDASTDGTLKQIDCFRDPRIIVRRNSVNGGQALNSQRATEIARGEFINIFHSDDVMRPHALSTYRQVIEDVVSRGLASRDSLLLTSQMRDIDENGRDLRNVHGGRPYYARLAKEAKALVGTFDLNETTYEIYRADRMLRYLIRNSYAAGAFSTMTFSRALYDKVGQVYVMRRYTVDKAFAYKLLSQRPTYIHVVAPLYDYRVHSMNEPRSYRSIDIRSVEDVVATYDTPETVWTTAGVTREEFTDLFVERKLGKVVGLVADGETPRAAACLGFAAICRGEITRTPRYRFYQLLLMSGLPGMVLAKILRRLWQHRDSNSRRM